MQTGSTVSRRVAAAVLVAGSFLILANLGNRYLWADEAETALLARNILHYGVPRAFDGKNLVSQELGRDYDANYLWRWTPWLPKYVAAASFLVLGESTASARLPFALIGILCIAALYLLALRLFEDPWTAALAMAFLAFSVPFLLYVRQCRYYSLAVLATIAGFHLLFGLVERRKGAAVGLVVALSVLFHSNYLPFVALLAGWAVCLPVFYPRREVLLRVAVAVSAALALNAPWFVFFRIFNKSADAERLYSVSRNLSNYYTWGNRFGFPLLAVALFLALLAWRRRAGAPLGAPHLRRFFFLLTFVGVYVAVISLAPWSFFRYLVGLLPVFALLLAYMCRAACAWNRAAGLAATGLLLFTGVFHTVSALPVPDPVYERVAEIDGSKPFNVWLPLYNYVDEVTHDFDGPIEGLVLLLRERARPADRVFISYGDLPLKFYTDLEVKGGQTGEDLSGWAMPDWVIVRAFYRFGDRPAMAADAERMRQYLGRLPRAAYRRLDVAILDLSWENIPEPSFHRFRTPQAGKPVRVMQRIRGDAP